MLVSVCLLAVARIQNQSDIPINVKGGFRKELEKFCMSSLYQLSLFLIAIIKENNDAKSTVFSKMCDCCKYMNFSEYPTYWFSQRIQGSAHVNIESELSNQLKL